MGEHPAVSPPSGRRRYGRDPGPTPRPGVPVDGPLAVLKPMGAANCDSHSWCFGTPCCASARYEEVERLCKLPRRGLCLHASLRPSHRKDPYFSDTATRYGPGSVGSSALALWRTERAHRIDQLLLADRLVGGPA